MNDHDIDLIVDLIENQLSGQEAEGVLARIKADPELSAAYEEQLAVRASLDAIPAASMTASEKESLNAALVAQLRLEEATPAVAVAPKRKAWWVPVVGIASAAVAVTAIFIVPGMSGSDDSSAATTFVASAAARAPEDAAADTDSAGAAEDGSADRGVAEEESETLAAPAPMTVVELEGADIEDVLDATAGESSPEAVQDRLTSLGFTKEATIPPDVLAECISRISDELPSNTTDIVLYGVDTSGPTLVAHIGLIFDDGIGAAMTIDLETCSIVDLSN
jgi:hypothetical protein